MPNAIQGDQRLQEPRYSPSTASGIHTALGRILATDVQQVRGQVPHRGYRYLGAYAFVLVLAGTGMYRDEHGVELSVAAGDLILLRPSVGHAYGPVRGGQWTERYVVFDGPVFSLWDELGLFEGRAPVISLGAVDDWNQRINHVLGESGRIGVPPALQEVCRLQEFLAEAMAARTDGGKITSADRTWLSSASALLSSSFTSHDDVGNLQAVADSLSISYDGFRKRFRQLAGVSPGRYRMLQRIRQACAMMQHGATTDREIAEALGFYDESHFSRSFKQVMGRSPREFRATLPTARH